MICDDNDSTCPLAPSLTSPSAPSLFKSPTWARTALEPPPAGAFYKGFTVLNMRCLTHSTIYSPLRLMPPSRHSSFHFQSASQTTLFLVSPAPHIHHTCLLFLFPPAPHIHHTRLLQIRAFIHHVAMHHACRVRQPHRAAIVAKRHCSLQQNQLLRQRRCKRRQIN